MKRRSPGRSLLLQFRFIVTLGMTPCLPRIPNRKGRKTPRNISTPLSQPPVSGDAFLVLFLAFYIHVLPSLCAKVSIGTGRMMTSASAVSAAPMPAILSGGKKGVGGDGSGSVGGAGMGGGGRGGQGPGAGDLVRIGTVVKDRRTVQDLEESRRKRHRGCDG